MKAKKAVSANSSINIFTAHLFYATAFSKTKETGGLPAYAGVWTSALTPFVPGDYQERIMRHFYPDDDRKINKTASELTAISGFLELVEAFSIADALNLQTGIFPIANISLPAVYFMFEGVYRIAKGDSGIPMASLAVEVPYQACKKAKEYISGRKK